MSKSITYKVVVHSDGSKTWYLNDKRHREDGPAIESSDGTKCWYLNGKRHREDGPAIESSDGSKAWWLNGEYMSEEEHRIKTQNPTCNGKIVEIDGKKYKLTEV